MFYLDMKGENMIEKPMDVLTHYEIRRTVAQKSVFTQDVMAYAQKLGYTTRVESGKRKCRNIIIGNPATAKYLVTAHYDTPAVMLLPNFITPCNPVMFFAYQLLIVFLFFAVAFIVSVLLTIFGCDAYAAIYIGYLTYIALFLLMLYGPANPHTANDNTSGVVSLLEIISTLPDNLRNSVCFILFDLEEYGTVGSAAYRKAHMAETDAQIVLNLDCVGDGDHIVLFAGKKLRKLPDAMERLRRLSGNYGNKHIAVHEKGFAHYPSDQRNFPLGVGIGVFRKKRGIGLYCSRIHTRRDTILEQTNVNLLRAALISFIASDVDILKK